jgi:hypothetical protein
MALIACWKAGKMGGVSVIEAGAMGSALTEVLAASGAGVRV